MGSSKEVGEGQGFGVTDNQVLWETGNGNLQAQVPDDVLSLSVPHPKP